MTMLLDELHAVSDEDGGHFGKLGLLLAVEETVVEGECEFLQDGEEDPVVQGEFRASSWGETGTRRGNEE